MNEENNINTPEFWNNKYKEHIYQDDHPEQFDYFKNVLDQLNFNKRTVLEIGCGLAQVSNYIFNNNLAHAVIASDQSVFIMDENEKRYKKNKFGFVLYCSDYTEALDNFNFDDVVAFEILEHFHSPETVIRNIFKKLPEGGRLIFSVPQENGLTDDDPYHHSQWDYNKTLFRMFQAGFVNVKLFSNYSNHNQIIGVAVK